MRLNKLIAAFAFMFLFAFDSFAQNAVLNSCYVVHKDKDMEGKQKGMRFHLNLSVNGKKDQKVWCIIEMGYYEGESLYYFTHSEGSFEYNSHLAVYKQLNSIYDNSTWSDLQLFMPYIEIKNSIGEKDWQKGITYCVKLVDSEGKVLLQEWQSSKRMIYYQKVYPWETCGICHGRGKCNLCNGWGKHYFSREVIKCTHCNGTGKCRYCKGSGRTKNQDLLSSYDIQSNNSNSGNITPYYDNTPVSNGGNYSKPETSSKTICSVCGGTGRCSNCAGRGEKNYSDGTKYECYLCGGGGVCKYCRGRGYIR